VSKKAKELEVIATIEELSIPLSNQFGGRDLLKDGCNLNTKLNEENHYFQHIHRFNEEPYPYSFVIVFDGIKYVGGPYKDAYIANIACAKKLYELNNLEEEPLIL
jgi:hypothetical protein